MHVSSVFLRLWGLGLKHIVSHVRFGCPIHLARVPAQSVLFLACLMVMVCVWICIFTYFRQIQMVLKEGAL